MKTWHWILIAIVLVILSIAIVLKLTKKKSTLLLDEYLTDSVGDRVYSFCVPFEKGWWEPLGDMSYSKCYYDDRQSGRGVFTSTCGGFNGCVKENISYQDFADAYTLSLINNII